MINRLKVFSPAIVVLIILVIAFFATPAFLPKGANIAGKESTSISSDDLMAYLQWKHNDLGDIAIRHAGTERILDYHRWKDAIEGRKVLETRDKDLLMAYLRWKHIDISDNDQKLSDAEVLMNYLQWKHNQPTKAEQTSDDTERLLKYLEWKHNQDFD